MPRAVFHIHPIPTSLPASLLLARRSTLINEFIGNSRESMLVLAEPRNHPRRGAEKGGAEGNIYISGGCPDVVAVEAAAETNAVGARTEGEKRGREGL